MQKDFENRKNNEQVVWVHCSSLGEFEQARPVIEVLSKDYSVLLTFFSPSGYEIRKDYAGAKWVYYLPMDTASNARKLIALVAPCKVYFTKYDFWYHYLNELKNRQIPTYLFSSRFRVNQIFFSTWGGFFRKMLTCFDHIFVQDSESMELLKNIGIEDVTVAGDTRFDRVFEIAQNLTSVEFIEDFLSKKKEDQQVLVLGSVWEEDVNVWLDFINNRQDYVYIIAPHEINKAQLERWNQQLDKSVTYFSGKTISDNPEVLMLDTIGLLSATYQYADVAYIGGGFGKGIHNTLEAAVFGIPVLFGPNYEKFLEAQELVGIGQATSISKPEEISGALERMDAPTIFKKSRSYFEKKVGATAVITNK